MAGNTSPLIFISFFFHTHQEKPPMIINGDYCAFSIISYNENN
jgi:hypothetical protein